MKTKKIFMRIIDISMTAVLLLLMAFQVTGQFAHEWLGVAMFVLTVIHHILNRKYYTSIFKGKYSAVRVFQTIVNMLLMLSFLGTALTGMIMSSYATTFMNGIVKTSIARQTHLVLSYWSFVLMGIHLGIHFGIISAKLRSNTAKTVLAVLLSGASVYGFWLFFKAKIPDYMLMRVPFAFLDYEKSVAMVIAENLTMMISWAFLAYLISLFLKNIKNKDKRKKAVLYCVLVAAIIIAAIVLNIVCGGY